MLISCISILFLVIVLGCSKEDDIVQKHEVKSGELLEVDFGGHPVEGRILIEKYPQNFDISELDRHIYRYRSIDGFKGRENVIIRTEGSSGDGHFDLIDRIELEITVK